MNAIKMLMQQDQAGAVLARQDSQLGLQTSAVGYDQNNASNWNETNKQAAQDRQPKRTQQIMQLQELQQDLKKEFLLVEKEQQEKNKLKREIEDCLRAYYLALIEMKHPDNALRKDDGFDNCYNFVKDVIIAISQNVHLGRQILLCLTDRSSLSSLFVQIIYESVQSTDPYFKDITKLVGLLLYDIYNDQIEGAQRTIIIAFLQQYMLRQEIVTYYQALAYNVFSKLCSLTSDEDNFKTKSLSPLGSQSEEDYYNQLTYSTSISNFGGSLLLSSEWNKGSLTRSSVGRNDDKIASLAEAYVQQILSEASLSPLPIKICAKTCYQAQHRANPQCKANEAKLAVWNLISCNYLKTFRDLLSATGVTLDTKALLKGIIDYLQREYGFSAQLRGEGMFLSQKATNFVSKLVDQLLVVNEEKYAMHQRGWQKGGKNECQKGGENDLQISVYGACISYQQLRELMHVIRDNRQSLMRINEKVVNRVMKIFQMSQDLVIFDLTKKGIDGSRQFVIINQLSYSEMIQCDYHKKYTVEYRDQPLKNTLRQILVEMDFIGLHHLNRCIVGAQRTIQQKRGSHSRNKVKGSKQKNETGICSEETDKSKVDVVKKEQSSEKMTASQSLVIRLGSVADILHNIVVDVQRSQSSKMLTNDNMINVSAQLLMKIKYVVYLLGKTHSSDEQLLEDMAQELLLRSDLSIKLYEDTKFSLLKVFCNIKHYKQVLRQLRDSEKKMAYRLKIIEALQQLRFKLCLTSPQSRNGKGINTNKVKQNTNQELGTQGSIDRYKYRLADSNDIIIAPCAECIHKENLFEGTAFHSKTVAEFVHQFASLREVKQAMSNPQFLAALSLDKTVQSVYLDRSKIKQSFWKFLGIVEELLAQIRGNSCEFDKDICHSVINRLLSQQLVSGSFDETDVSQSRIQQSQQDKLLLERASQYALIKKMNGSKEKKSTDEINKSDEGGSNDPADSQYCFSKGQVVEIGSKFLLNINKSKTPETKMRKLREMAEIYRVILHKFDQQKQFSLEWMIYKTVVRTQPINLVTNLTFIELFLSEQKLMSIEGKLLEQIKSVVRDIISMQISPYLAMERHYSQDLLQEVLVQSELMHQFHLIRECSEPC